MHRRRLAPRHWPQAIERAADMNRRHGAAQHERWLVVAGNRKRDPRLLEFQIPIAALAYLRTLHRDGVFEQFFEANQPSGIGFNGQPTDDVGAACGVGVHPHAAPGERAVVLLPVAPVHVFQVIAVGQVADGDFGFAQRIVHGDGDGVLDILTERIVIKATGVTSFLNPAHRADARIQGAGTKR